MKKPAVTIEPRFRITGRRRFAFGPGMAELLGHIGQSGSIADAAKAMGMSYMRAWTLVKKMNAGFVEPLVETTRGGRQQGGAKLTETGDKVLQLYRQLETQSLAATHSIQSKFARLLHT